MHVRRLMVVIIATALAVVALLPELAGASPTASQSGRHRTGGRVHLTWPYAKKGRPTDALSRWLARQSGPACSKHRKKKARRSCPTLKTSKKKHKAGKASEAMAIPAVDRGPKRYDANPVARIAESSGTESPLALTRSYQIPADDPSYDRL